MAIEKTYLLGKNITLGCGFDLQAKAPLDSRQVVPEYAGLQALIDGNAAYEGMIVYDEGTKKTYQAQIVDGVLAFREFGISEAELKELIASETTAAMEFKGAATALPENPAKGDFYKVTAEFDVAEGETAKIGDSIVYDGEQWFLIPSGDDIEDTWRPVTDVDNDATLTFVAGDKLEKTVAADGTITYKHVAVDAPELLAENEQTRTYITEVETDGFGHITGYKTATENVVDTNTTYEFEGQSEESSVYFTTTSSEENANPVTVYLDAYSKNEADGKFVAKEGYIAYTQDEKDKLAGLSNYDDEEVRGLIGDNAKAIEDLETYVGTVPTDDKYKDLSVVAYINKKAEETLAAAQGGSSETAASVKQQLDNYKSENDTRVKAVEDDIKAINDSENGILKQAQNYADGLAGNYDEAGAAAGVKTELTTEINKKVDKVEGKDLISTSEIERLATLSNYDDTQVKADIAKKADAEAMTTELGKKVDKVEGKDLIATSEIERLLTLKNYDDTALAGRVTTAEGKITALETESAKHALKTEVEAVDAKFADYTKTSDLPTDLGDFTNNAGYAKTADVNTELDKKADKTQVATDMALKADKSVVDAMYTNDQIDGFLAGKVDKETYAEDKATFALKSEISSLTGKADKSYVDEELAKKVNVSDYNNDKATFALKTDFNAYRTSADQDVIDQDFEDRIADLEAIDHDQLAKDASAAAVATVLDGAPEKFNTLKEIAAWIAEADTAEDAASLVTRVSALEAIDHDAYVDADAELKEALEGKINAINNHSHTFVESELNEIKAGDVAKWNAEIGAKALAETKTTTAEVKTQIEAYGYATEADLTLAEGRIATLEAIDHDAYKSADATLKSELQAEIDADVKVVNDAFEAYKTSNDTEVSKKANSADVYTKTETYTQEEVDALIEAAHTWGEF